MNAEQAYQLEASGGRPAWTDDLLAAVRFIDVEASGLHQSSYPVEIAWCGLDLLPVSMLVKPLDSWGLVDWSPEAEKVHGIPLATLHADGIDAKTCAEAMAEALRGCVVVSDAPQFDARWLGRLFAETGVKAGFNLGFLDNIQAACARRSKPPYQSEQELMQRMEDIVRFYPHTHRAGEDCLSMAAVCRGLYDHEWREALFRSGREGRLPPL